AARGADGATMGTCGRARCAARLELAESGGFEPPKRGLDAYTLSRRAPSTTRTPLRACPCVLPALARPHGTRNSSLPRVVSTRNIGPSAKVRDRGAGTWQHVARRAIRRIALQRLPAARPPPSGT